MNFAALPPEVNSGLMYAGPGPGPMLSAAAAWDGLAAELHSTATSYESLISELTSGSWVGPSSAAMAAAVTPYLVWMNTTAIQAEKTATQVKAAVAAYEAAFAMTVPPTVVAANRTLLMTLVATNVFGQNSAAIAANEAQYGEMWAQDAGAMYGYAAASPTAAEVEPFSPPPQTSNPAGQVGQAAAVGQALGGSAGNNAQSLPVQLSAMLQGLAAPTQGASLPAIPPLQAVPTGPFDLLGIIADEIGIGVALPLSIVGVWLAGAAMYYAELDSREILEAQDVLAGGQSTILDAIEELLGPGSASLSSSGIPVSAGIGQAVSAGNLSVPPSWATVAPEIRTTAYASPDTGAAGTPGGLGTAFSQMAMAGMAGSALAGAVRPGRQGSASPGTTEPPKPAAEPSSQGPAEPPPQPAAISVKEMAEGIRELGELRDSGLITEAEFTEQKRRLLSR